LSAIIHTEV